jgi:hypothetical protein
MICGKMLVLFSFSFLGVGVGVGVKGKNELHVVNEWKKPCKGKSSGKNLSEGKRVQSA